MDETTAQTIRTPGETAGYLDLPELAVIPSSRKELRMPGGLLNMRLVIRIKRPKRALTHSGPEPAGAEDTITWRPRAPRDRVELVTWQRKTSQAAEAFRSVVSAILAPPSGIGRARVLVITSPSAMEGKSTVACNLAIALAGEHPDVLLLDADSRSPALHRIFNVPNDWGLRDLLREKRPVLYLPAGALARRTALPGLRLLPHGSCPEGGVESLVSDRFPELILRCRRLFHTVVIDAAPLLQSPETTWLARLADGVILVVRADQTRHQEALRAAQMLRADGIRVIGTILNDWDPRSSGGQEPARCRFDPGE